MLKCMSDVNNLFVFSNAIDYLYCKALVDKWSSRFFSLANLTGNRFMDPKIKYISSCLILGHEIYSYSTKFLYEPYLNAVSVPGIRGYTVI